MTAATARLPRAGLGPTRADVLAHLRGHGRPVPVTTVAKAVGLHANTARFHLDGLVGQGLATREHEQRNGPGRPRLLYRAEPVATDEPAGYRDLAGALIRHLARLGGDVDQAEEAGLFWGRDLAREHPDQPPLARTLAVLDDLGYQPELAGDPVDTITLTPCPFAGLAVESLPDGELPAICRLHLGLIRGLLADDAVLTVTGLHPWTTPTTCTAGLRRTDA